MEYSFQLLNVHPKTTSLNYQEIDMLSLNQQNAEFDKTKKKKNVIPNFCEN